MIIKLIYFYKLKTIKNWKKIKNHQKLNLKKKRIAIKFTKKLKISIEFNQSKKKEKKKEK